MQHLEKKIVRKPFACGSWLLLLYLHLISITAFSQVINRAEYFFDTDPGNGNATSVTVPTPGASVNFNFSVSAASLSTGFHILGFRFHESITGRWSHAQFSAFYIVPSVQLSNASNLVAGEYFLDSDPGFGNGVSFPFSPSATITVPLTNLSIGSLTPGFHLISFRFKDDKGKWTHNHSQSFYVVPPSATPNAVSLKQIEYFFDTDPGQGNGTPLTITAGSPQNNNFLITLPGTLAPGFHKLGFRYRDNFNRWTHGEFRSFYIVNTGLLTPSQIVAAEYYLDDSMGIGTPKPITGITPGASIDQIVALDMTGVPAGPHTLSIRAKDTKGFWSYLVTENFIVSACTPPTAPIAPTVTRCSEGTVDLTASGAIGSQVYRWYDDPILNNLLFTGEKFTTPSLSASKVYYVSIYDPITSCESSRVSVTAAVIVLPIPIINPSGNLSICEGSSIFLSAPAGFSQYTWSDNQITQQILVTKAGDYSVKTGNGTCESESSLKVTIVVIPAPAKPVISTSGSTTICGTGSVTLSGPPNVEYIWSTGANTSSISVSQTGVFYLIVKTPGASCPSLPSDPVVVTVLTPPCNGGGTTNLPPVIITNTLAAQIEGKVEIDLTKIVSDPDNNLNYSSLRVVNNSTSKGAPAFVSSSFELIIDYNGLPFTGTDRITIEVCDLAGACVQQVIGIDVVGEVVVFNGITPDGDGLNDILFIKYVDVVEGAAQNNVTIYNRWGDLVFETDNYDNVSQVFAGQTNSGKDLPSGTYFYKMDFANGKSITGFITLKR